MDNKDNFAGYPLSITEGKFERALATGENNGSIWTPRDCLIHVLRQIDEGKLDPDNLIVMARNRSDNEDPNRPGWYASCKDIHTMVGIIEMVKQRIITE